MDEDKQQKWRWNLILVLLIAFIGKQSVHDYFLRTELRSLRAAMAADKPTAVATSSVEDVSVNVDRIPSLRAAATDTPKEADVSSESKEGDTAENGVTIDATEELNVEEEEAAAKTVSNAKEAPKSGDEDQEDATEQKEKSTESQPPKEPTMDTAAEQLSSDSKPTTEEPEEPLMTPTKLTMEQEHKNASLPIMKRNIVFMHVGKAGGSTLNFLFQRRCWKNREKSVNQECLDNNPPQSTLDRDVIADAHMGFGKQSVAWPNTTSFLFSIRNPITRSISAFKFLHPNSTVSALAKERFPSRLYFYQTCFPTWDHLHQSVIQVFEEIRNNPDNPQLTECQKTGIRVLQGNVLHWKKMNIHLVCNHDFYADESMREFPSREVFAIRTEHLWEDTRNLDILLGGTGDFGKTREVANANPAMKKAVPKQYPKICCVVYREIHAFQEILDRSANLNKAEKADSMQDVLDTCGIDDKTQIALQRPKFGYGIRWAAWHKRKCPDVESLVHLDPPALKEWSVPVEAS